MTSQKEKNCNQWDSIGYFLCQLWFDSNFFFKTYREKMVSSYIRRRQRSMEFPNKGIAKKCKGTTTTDLPFQKNCNFHVFTDATYSALQITKLQKLRN